MYNHNKAQHSKNRVHISWDILYMLRNMRTFSFQEAMCDKSWQIFYYNVSEADLAYKGFKWTST